ncbi:MAG: LysR family transcriptional regulator [Rhodobacteraceae bacterium]|nr:LysR family transcriptional regulator [Paracoccaceae bacterium]
MADIVGLAPKILLSFVAIFEEGSVSLAAARLNMTQQGLSGILSRLRARFNDPLFVRVPHGMAPTPRAEMLYPKIKRAVEALEALIEDPVFNPERISKTICIAASDYAVSVIVQPLFQRLALAAPGLRLTVIPLQADKLVEQMHVGMVDVALTVPAFLPPNLHHQHLFSDSYKCTFRQGHPLAGQRLTLSLFCQQAHLLIAPNGKDAQSEIDQILADHGVARDVRLALPSFLNAESFLEASNLVALLPQRILQNSQADLAVVEPPFSVPAFEIVSAWPPRVHADPTNIWLRNQLQALNT